MQAVEIPESTSDVQRAERDQRTELDSAGEGFAKLSDRSDGRARCAVPPGRGYESVRPPASA